MARRKGKSERRIKNWHQRYRAGDEIEDIRSRHQRLSSPGVKLPPRDLSAGQENLDDLPRIEGMVVGLFPGGVMVSSQSEELLCGIAGTFRAPDGASALAVGDNVTVAVTRDEHASETAQEDKDRSDGMILTRQDRNTVLSRPQPRSDKKRDEHSTETFEKVIAANMDLLVIVASTHQPPFRHGLIDRFLIIAERGGLKSLLAINKIDLGKPDKQTLKDFKDLGVDIITCSASAGKNITKLKKLLTGQKAILAGASGVGKSTLINAIIPDAEAATREVRTSDQRGRHTTSAAVVYPLPDGGMIVDTPGLRELGLHMDTVEVGWYFPEFEQFADKCKFNNCTHTHEPDCAVIAAVEEGKILPRRYNSYLRILETLENNKA